MPKNETGEFELVLGNRQLLSGFAVVVILLGVFFAMGYIVGRNSTPSSRAAASETEPPAASGVAQPEPGRAQSSPVTAGTTEPANTSPTQTPPAATETKPAQETKAANSEEAKPAEKPASAEAPAVPAAESLQPGTYLQVIATIKSDAEVISKSLQDRRFPTVITASSLEGRFRVLVGPYRDASAAGGAKSELENLGFHPIAVKITEKN